MNHTDEVVKARVDTAKKRTAARIESVEKHVTMVEKHFLYALEEKEKRYEEKLLEMEERLILAMSQLRRYEEADESETRRRTGQKR